MDHLNGKVIPIVMIITTMLDVNGMEETAVVTMSTHNFVQNANVFKCIPYLFFDTFYESLWSINKDYIYILEHSFLKSRNHTICSIKTKTTSVYYNKIQ